MGSRSVSKGLASRDCEEQLEHLDYGRIRPKSLALTPGEKRGAQRAGLNVRAQAQVTGSGLGFGPLGTQESK